MGRSRREQGWTEIDAEELELGRARSVVQGKASRSIVVPVETVPAVALAVVPAKLGWRAREGAIAKLVFLWVLRQDRDPAMAE